ncbi:hypothetical protein RUMHYD_00326 [Blautia hydrogenotrophica DSM 10507]|uniref:Uncharacterized protein n=1 Tax=Blautia hydrogenotrophica (strain DSM 10507 / JCM 14656 / S5a33) TaxID=476272 RepID=C0CHL2_BLAHS|nr:hypothetical protein RUMHYD_00326 [Blautia hydrogenotrophica DSM 10507]
MLEKESEATYQTKSWCAASFCVKSPASGAACRGHASSTDRSRAETLVVFAQADGCRTCLLCFFSTWISLIEMVY